MCLIFFLNASKAQLQSIFHLHCLDVWHFWFAIDGNTQQFGTVMFLYLLLVSLFTKNEFVNTFLLLVTFRIKLKNKFATAHIPGKQTIVMSQREPALPLMEPLGSELGFFLFLHTRSVAITRAQKCDCHAHLSQSPGDSSRHNSTQSVRPQSLHQFVCGQSALSLPAVLFLLLPDCTDTVPLFAAPSTFS